MDVFLPLNISLKSSKFVVRRKYGATCGSAAISPAVIPATAIVGAKWCPLATSTGKSQISF
jgi:hypothetical protein